MSDLYEDLYDDAAEGDQKPLVSQKASGSAAGASRASGNVKAAAAKGQPSKGTAAAKEGEVAQASRSLPQGIQKALAEARAAQNELLKDLQSLTTLSGGLNKLQSLAEFAPRKEKAMALRDKISSQDIKKVETAHAALQRQLKSSASSKALSDTQLTEVTSEASKIASSIESSRKHFSAVSAQVSKVFSSRETILRAKEAQENDPEAQAEREADEALQQEVKRMEINLDDDEEAIKEMQREITDINEMMKQMGMEVDAQQETINLIESNVDQAEAKAESGVKNLESAKKHQRCGKKILLYGGIAVGVLVVVLLLVFLL